MLLQKTAKAQLEINGSAEGLFYTTNLNVHLHGFVSLGQIIYSIKGKKQQRFRRVFLDEYLFVNTDKREKEMTSFIFRSRNIFEAISGEVSYNWNATNYVNQIIQRTINMIITINLPKLCRIHKKRANVGKFHATNKNKISKCPEIKK